MKTTILALLRRHPAFDRAKLVTLAALAQRAVVRELDRGEVAARARSKHDKLLLVVEGALELSHPASRGSAAAASAASARARRNPGHVLLGRIDAPTLFGDATLHGDGVWPVTARAAEDGALVVELIPVVLDRALEDDAPLAAELWRAACRRHFRSICLRRTLVLHGTAGQVLELLARQPAAPWTTTSLARSLGLDRSTVWRQLKELTRDGAVVVERGRVRLAD